MHIGFCFDPSKLWAQKQSVMSLDSTRDLSCPLEQTGDSAPIFKETDFKVVDQRETKMKISDAAQAVFKGTKRLFGKMQRVALAKRFPTPIVLDGKVQYASEALPWKNKDSDSLYLFVHGLWGTPSDWASYIDKVEGTKATIFAPNVYEKGNVPLAEAAEPILAAVRDYLKEHPGKPIHIFGTSNGSRIIAYIENHLTHAELGHSPLRVVSIAGVLGGTKIVDRLYKYHLGHVTQLDPRLQKELKWQSAMATTILKEWGEKQKAWRENGQDVRHFFCATFEDELVRPIISSLPNSEYTVSNHVIFSGQSHTSIIDGACSTIFNWLERNSVMV